MSKINDRVIIPSGTEMFTDAGQRIVTITRHTGIVTDMFDTERGDTVVVKVDGRDEIGGSEVSVDPADILVSAPVHGVNACAVAALRSMRDRNAANAARDDDGSRDYYLGKVDAYNLALALLGASDHPLPVAPARGEGAEIEPPLRWDIEPPAVGACD